MKPSRFAYHAPRSVDECLALLAEHGEDAKLLAGGQSLVPLMNLRLAAPEVVIDLNRVEGLEGVREEDGRLVVGAMTRHRELASSELVRRACPLLADAAALIGYPPIRNRGTIGGSLSHADPASELPCVAVALDAEIVAAHAGGRRTIAAGDFFVSHFTTALEPTELVVEVRFPRRADGSAWRFLEFARKRGDFALASVAVELSFDGTRVGRARIGVGGVGEHPWRASRAEELLASAEPDDELLGRAAGEAGEQAPGDAYRSHLVATLTRRALRGALETRSAT